MHGKDACVSYVTRLMPKPGRGLMRLAPNDVGCRPFLACNLTIRVCLPAVNSNQHTREEMAAADRSHELLAELAKRGFAAPDPAEDAPLSSLTDEQLLALAKKSGVYGDTMSVTEAKDRHQLKVMTQTEERKLYPVLTKIAVVQDFVTRVGTVSALEQKANLVSRAKAHKLSPTDVMTTVVAVCGGADAQKVLAQLVLDFPDPAERVKQYNLWIASLWGDSFVKRHNEKLLALTYPLYPPGTREFEDLNIELLDAVKAVVVGGGTESRYKVDEAEAAALYSKPKNVLLRSAQSRADTATSLKALGGIVPAAVVSDGHGGYCVDLAPVATAFTSMAGRQDESDRQVNRLHEELRQLKAKSGTGTSDAFADRGGRGRGGRGGNRGRGGGGGGGGRGGVFGAGAAAVPDDVDAAIASGFH